MKNFIFNILEFLKLSLQAIKTFFSRLKRSFILMSLIEKRAFYLISIVLILLVGILTNNFYIDHTDKIPSGGGTYKEAIAGELKYINPVLASSDADSSVSKLLFSGLVKFDQDKILPDLAESWEVGSDGLEYRFKLKKDIKFSDGESFGAGDIIYTVNKIKDPSFKSPLYDSWKDVEVSSDDEGDVIFTLKKPYGPFIYNCNFGILPSYLSDQEFSKSFVGTGPFKYSKAITEQNKIKEIRLERNSQYYLGKPYLKKIYLKFFASSNEAQNLFESGKVDGIFGAASSIGNNLSYKSSKQLALILNLRSELLKDKNNREKILGSGKFDEEVNLKLVTLDGALQKEKVGELERQLGEKNIQLAVEYKNSIDIQDSLKKKDFDLLLYGFNFHKDRDPYMFWHSSQLGGMNLAGLSNKDMDILIEDARMLQDSAERNNKYNQFYSYLGTEYIAQFFEPVNHEFSVGDKIKGIQAATDIEASSRYDNIGNWYIYEKRVKK